MPDTYNWYVLYTKTNAEECVMHGMGEAFRKMRLDYRFEPFCPHVEYYFRNKQAIIDGTNERFALDDHLATDHKGHNQLAI